MKLLLPILIALCAAPSVAKADGPLISPWVELSVMSCLPATFEAPLYETSNYVRGDSYRTALVTGTVLRSGMHDYDRLREIGMTEEEINKAVQFTIPFLPRMRSTLSVVLREWDAEFCQQAQGKTIRFDFNYMCDTTPFRRACLPPLPLVDLSD